ncbi:MAG: hypothetical protein ACR2GZ_05060 [Solirubrobacteraceae bacterium]
MRILGAVRARPGTAAELEALLGRGVPEIVDTLVSELTKAMAGIEARNSALMLNAEPMLNALRELEAAARVPDAKRAQTGLDDLRPAWNALRARLDAEAQRAR